MSSCTTSTVAKAGSSTGGPTDGSPTTVAWLTVFVATLGAGVCAGLVEVEEGVAVVGRRLQDRVTVWIGVLEGDGPPAGRCHRWLR